MQRYARAAAQRGELDVQGASERAHAANIYANKKNKRYNKIITEKNLDLNYESFTVESFGAFATDTWKFINTVCDPNTHPNANDEYNPWNNPDPSRAFILVLLALPINVATQSCCCTQIVGVASSAPVVGTPRVNRTGRSTSHIVSRYCVSK